MHPIMFFVLSLFCLLWTISQLVELSRPLIRAAIRFYTSL